MSEANKVAKNSLLYTVAHLVTKASGFLLLFLYTNPNILSTEDYGRVNLLSSFINVTVIFVNLSLNHALIRYYADYKYDTEKCKKFFGTIISFMLVFGTLVVLLALIFRNSISPVLFKGIKPYPIILTFLTMLFNAVYQMYQAILQARQEGKLFAANGLLFFAMNVVLNVIFLIFGRGVYVFGNELGGVNGMVLSLFLTNVAFAAYGVVYMIKKRIMVFGIDLELLKISLLYALPILPYNLTNNMASYISKHFLNAEGLAAQNGIYSVSMQFSSIIDIIQTSINLAFRPWFNDKMKQGEEGKKEIISFTSLAFKVSCIVCLGVALYAQDVVILLNKNYYDAWKYVPIIACAHAVKFVFFTHTIGIMYDIKQSRKMFLCSGSAIAVNFALSFILSHFEMYNMLAAASCFFISRTVAAVISVVICRRADIIRYDIAEMFKQILMVAVFSAIGLVPFNYIVVGNGHQLALFSGQFFINFAIKTIVFVIGVLCIVGKQRKEVVDFAIGIFKKKAKKTSGSKK